MRFVLAVDSWLGMIAAEKNRYHSGPASIRAQIKKHIIWLEKQVAELENDLDKLIRSTPAWREKDDLLRSCKGIGPTTSHTMLACLPELGFAVSTPGSLLLSESLLSIEIQENSVANVTSRAVARRFAVCSTWRPWPRSVPTS